MRLLDEMLKAGMQVVIPEGREVQKPGPSRQPHQGGGMMTRRRADIATSLAERGRPEMWANEAEAASLCGLSPNEFKAKLPDLERQGFPPQHPVNGKRYIPHILAFFDNAANAKPVAKTGERSHESFGNDKPPRSRLAA